MGGFLGSQQKCLFHLIRCPKYFLITYDSQPYSSYLHTSIHSSSRQGMPWPKKQGRSLYINNHLLLFRLYIPIHWVPAIPAGMAINWYFLCGWDSYESRNILCVTMKDKMICIMTCLLKLFVPPNFLSVAYPSKLWICRSKKTWGFMPHSALSLCYWVLCFLMHLTSCYVAGKKKSIAMVI